MQVLLTVEDDVSADSGTPAAGGDLAWQPLELSTGSVVQTDVDIRLTGGAR
jgi:hypothetical protein